MPSQFHHCRLLLVAHPQPGLSCRAPVPLCHNLWRRMCYSHPRWPSAWSTKVRFQGIWMLMMMMMTLETKELLDFRQTVADFVKVSPPPVQTTPNLVWRMPSNSAPSSASASATPPVPVLQMRSMQRTPERHMPDVQQEDDEPYYARLQQNNGGE